MQSPPSGIPPVSTDRPAPLLSGFYSIQALSRDAGIPHITQYHRKPEPALKWMQTMAKSKIHDAFLLSSSGTSWDVYDGAGRIVQKRAMVLPDSGIFKESPGPVEVDSQAYEKSVQGVLGDSVKCIAFADHHSHASSVGHSNMVVIACVMVMEASDEDLEHIYLADSIASGCRVQGWFMDTSAVSEPLMDKYLDRYKWLSNGWPLANDHHAQVLAYRMATLRPQQVLQVLMTAIKHANFGEDIRRVAKRLHKVPPEAFIDFTAKLMEELEPGVLLTRPQDIEQLDEELIVMQAKRIARLYRDTFKRRTRRRAPRQKNHERT